MTAHQVACVWIGLGLLLLYEWAWIIKHLV